VSPTDINPLQTLLLIWAAGGTVHVDGDRLIVRGATMCEELREAIRHNRDALIAALRPVGGKESA